MELRAAAARLTLERDREELRQSLVNANESPGTAFPRSATFRWLLANLSPRSLASTAVTAALMKPGLMQYAVRWVFSRRRARPVTRTGR
jgi:hypothetical protein